MEFWRLAFTRQWVTLDQLRIAVKTDKNIFGEISVEEFEDITGTEF